MENLADVTTPCVVDGYVLFSIFDDSDPFYHSDSVTGQTPARERQSEINREDATRA